MIPLKELNAFLKGLNNLSTSPPPLFVFITGASGAGKSYLANALEQALDPKFGCVEYFDRIGIPPFDDMIKECGSVEKWQEIMTHKWVRQIGLKQDKRVVILEGQFNPQFAIDGCRELGVSNYVFIVLHAERKTREHRLINDRVQPELANETMNNWAEFLKHKTREIGGIVIDTSDSDLTSNLNQIAELIKKAFKISKFP